MKNQLKTEKPKSNNKEKKDIKFNPLAKLNFDFLSFYKDERLQKITGLATNDLDNLASTLVKLGNNFATTESEIITAATQIATATAGTSNEFNK